MSNPQVLVIFQWKSSRSICTLGFMTVLATITENKLKHKG